MEAWSPRAGAVSTDVRRLAGGQSGAQAGHPRDQRLLRDGRISARRDPVNRSKRFWTLRGQRPAQLAVLQVVFVMAGTRAMAPAERWNDPAYRGISPPGGRWRFAVRSSPQLSKISHRAAGALTDGDQAGDRRRFPVAEPGIYASKSTKVVASSNASGGVSGQPGSRAMAPAPSQAGGCPSRRTTPESGGGGRPSAEICAESTSSSSDRSPDRPPIRPPDCTLAGPPVRRSAGLHARRSAGPPDCTLAGPPVRRTARSPVRRSAGLHALRSAGPPDCTLAGPPVRRSAGPPVRLRTARRLA